MASPNPHRPSVAERVGLANYFAHHVWSHESEVWRKQSKTLKPEHQFVLTLTPAQVVDCEALTGLGLELTRVSKGVYVCSSNAPTLQFYRVSPSKLPAHILGYGRCHTLDINCAYCEEGQKYDRSPQRRASGERRPLCGAHSISLLVFEAWPALRTTRGNVRLRVDVLMGQFLQDYKVVREPHWSDVEWKQLCAALELHWNDRLSLPSKEKLTTSLLHHETKVPLLQKE